MTSTRDAVLLPEQLDLAANRLLTAQRQLTPCAPVRDLIGSDAAAAYAVQQRVVSDRVAAGGRVVGHKIGLTSPAVQRQLGVEQPDFGVLFADMAFASGDLVPTRGLLQPRVEAEVAFVLSRDLVHGDLGLDQVRASVEYAVAALEVVDSRVANWDIRFADTVADNASGGLFVLGEQRLTLEEVEPVDVRMRMTVDGVEVSRGTGADCLGDPLLALQWLARTSRDLGEPLRRGHVVLSGALGPMTAVLDTSGGALEVSADIQPLGTVSATFEGARA